MHLLLTNINGNPNVGLYGFANNRYALVGQEVPKQLAEQMGQVLKVPVHRITIAGTSLVGAFVAGNDHSIVVPSITFESELRVLEKLGIPHQKIETKLTALGNNVLCSNRGAIVHPEFSADTKKRIRQALNVVLHPGTIADIPTVGSVGAGHASAMVIHRDASEADQREVAELLGVACDTGTINHGSPHVRSGILCNDHGMVVSDQSWGPEIGFVDEVLFLRNAQ